MSVLNKLVEQTYNIGIIRRDISELLNAGIKDGEICWLKHNYKDRYFADPFLWYQDEEFFFILVEEFLFWEEKGKISLLKVKKDDFSLVSRRVVIEEDTHLSFPFCEENGNVIIPESVKSGRCIAYSLDKDTLSVIKKENIVEFGTIDQVIFSNDSGKWLFTCLTDLPKEELFLYKLDDINSEPHKNPVVSDIRYARSAGRIITRDGKVYRPVQDSTGRYGYQTRILQITRLDEKGYEFVDLATVNGSNNPPFNETLHTFNAYEGFCIIDGSRDYIRPIKVLYKKARWIFRFLKRNEV